MPCLKAIWQRMSDRGRHPISWPLHVCVNMGMYTTYTYINKINLTKELCQIEKGLLFRAKKEMLMQV